MLAVESFEEVEPLLSGLALHELDELLQEVIVDLSPLERRHYDLCLCIHDFRDSTGRVRYLRWLWEEGVVVCVRSPYAAHSGWAAREQER